MSRLPFEFRRGAFMHPVWAGRVTATETRNRQMLMVSYNDDKQTEVTMALLCEI
jgi:hypothetical protein